MDKGGAPPKDYPPRGRADEGRGVPDFKAAQRCIGASATFYVFFEAEVLFKMYGIFVIVRSMCDIYHMRGKNRLVYKNKRIGFGPASPHYCMQHVADPTTLSPEAKRRCASEFLEFILSHSRPSIARSRCRRAAAPSGTFSAAERVFAARRARRAAARGRGRAPSPWPPPRTPSQKMAGPKKVTILVRAHTPLESEFVGTVADWWAGGALVGALADAEVGTAVRGMPSATAGKARLCVA